MTLTDTNVLIDIVSNDPIWFDWLIDALTARGAVEPLLIDGVIYAELSARMTTEAAVSAAVAELDVQVTRSPQLALFWPVKPSANIGRLEARVRAYCPTFLSVHMRRFSADLF